MVKNFSLPGTIVSVTCQALLIETKGKDSFMKINFTKKEYLLLLDVLYMADWVLNAHKEAD